VGLLGLLFTAGFVSAQSPGMGQAPGYSNPPNVVYSMTSEGYGMAGSGGCASCCKSCQMVPSTTTRSHTVYCCKEVDYCLPPCPRCGLLAMFGDGCCEGGGCGKGGHGCAQCGEVRTKTVLLKRVCKEQCPSFKCVVEGSPGCCGSAPHGSAPIVAPPPWLVPGQVTFHGTYQRSGGGIAPISGTPTLAGVRETPAASMPAGPAGASLAVPLP
jgi:hypothetical protein